MTQVVTCLLLALFACAAILGQPQPARVSVQFTPEPMAVLDALGLKTLGLWSVAACNDGIAVAVIPPERFQLAAGPRLRIVAPDRVKAMLERQRERTWASVAMNLAGGGAFLAAGLTGFGPVAARKEWIVSLAWTGGLLTKGSEWCKAKVPSLGPYAESLLTEPVTLGPGQCATKTVFAAKMQGAQAFGVTIGGP